MAVPVLQSSTVRARGGTYAGLFIVTLSTLMYEISLTRIFSVTMWYHFAFVAISVALFGLTLGALIVHLLPHRFAEVQVKRHLWVWSLTFSVAIAVCFVTQLSIPFVPRLSFTGLWSVVMTCLVISVPFVASGIVVCLSLTRFPTRVNRLYAADLIGAGLGCVLLVVLFSWIDGPSLVILIGAIAGLGALVFALDAGAKLGAVVSAVVMVSLAGFALLNGYLSSQGDPFLRIAWTKEQPDTTHDYERWNAFSRLTVDGDTDDKQIGMLIDSTAGTGLVKYTGDPAETDFLRGEIPNLAHHARADADVLVIGVGGGRDVLSALEFDQRSVTGVELNGDILDITNDVYGDYTGQLDRNPKVKFVNDEARSYLARTDTKYDIIQISLIDTWAATAAGAFALSENSLYTAEAWDVFFDRLEPGGILTVSRWYDTFQLDKPLEAMRTTAVASQALKEHGVENPRDHVQIYRGQPGFYGTTVATMLVSPDPFTAGDTATLARAAEEQNFDPVLTPDESLEPIFAELTVPEGPDDAVASVREDISPPTDNRPYFFQMADLATVFSRRVFHDDQSTRPVLVLGLLAVTVLGLAAACIALPLFATRRRKLPGGPTRGMVPYYTYFAGIGLGFLLVEVSQLQRLNIFLGHPTYALSVVLFSVLLSSGVGSMLSERFLRRGGATASLAPLAALIVALGIFGIVTPEVIGRMDGATTPVRIAVAVGIIFPLGLLMGMPFAIGMRAASARPGVPTAFLWGINGATSVCASVFGVVISLFFGIATAFTVGALAYAAALVSLLVITRTGPVGEPAVVEEPEPERIPAAAGVG